MPAGDKKKRAARKLQKRFSGLKYMAALNLIDRVCADNPTMLSAYPDALADAAAKLVDSSKLEPENHA